MEPKRPRVSRHVAAFALLCTVTAFFGIGLIALRTHKSEPTVVAAQNKATVPVADSASDLPNQTDASTKSTRGETIEVIHPSGEKIKATLIPLGSSPEQIDQGAPYIRQMGYACEHVTELSQLRQENGEDMDIFKVTCSGGETYQTTLLNGKNYTKPWTGRLLGW